MRNFGLVCAAALVTVFALDASAQTLADIARRERARQRPGQNIIVITNGVTVTTAASTSGTAVVPAPAGNEAQTAAKPGGPGEITDNQGHNQKYWRDAFQKARDEVTRAEAKVQILEMKVRDLNMGVLRQSDVYNRENRLGAEITAAQAELDQARREAEQARQKITDLEDELRRSGGPPGWAR
jgi:chromosome segregation ATPase